MSVERMVVLPPRRLGFRIAPVVKRKMQRTRPGAARRGDFQL